jgi:hypothetical protein
MDAPFFQESRRNQSKEKYPMDTIEGLHERVEVLEHQIEALTNRAHVIERRLRWWCALACVLLVLGLFSLPLPSSTAQEESSEYRGMRKRLAALEYKLQYVEGGANEVVITGANLRIVNGLGSTETVNGLGNLIVGYNELIGFGEDNRTGSHNVVVGEQNNFSRFGGLVVGRLNEISGDFSSVSGGAGNTASGFFSSVSGGLNNKASGNIASVSGGFANTASGDFGAWASGGAGNTASGIGSSVSGGIQNTASGNNSSVSGGFANRASEQFASVSGGAQNTASGDRSSVSGGAQNTASGFASSVSGGLNRTAPGEFNWAAGPLFAAQ